MAEEAVAELENLALDDKAAREEEARPDSVAQAPEAGHDGAHHVAQAVAEPPNVGSIDHALRDALYHPKNRTSVLRLEAEVEAFVMGSSDAEYVFTADMSSYERLLAHRTAQHWGLETSTINAGADQGRIVAYRTPGTRPPHTKLCDVTAAMASEAAAAAGAAGLGPAPRVLVRRRPDRGPGARGPPGGMDPGALGGWGGAPMNGGGGAPHRGSLAERELEYSRRRAELGIGDYGMPYGAAAAGYAGMAPALGLSSPGAMTARGPGAAALNGAGGPPGASMGPLGAPAVQLQYGPAVGPSPYGAGAGGRGGGPPGGGGPRKAQMRNREADMADPDFRRGRHLHGPRYDPGYGEDPSTAASMYARPNYTSEFPELGGAGSRGPPAGANGGAGGTGGGPPGAARSGAGMAYGAAYPAPGMGGHAGGMVPVPYGYTAQGMVPPGMMAGPMAAMHGGVQMAGVYGMAVPAGMQVPAGMVPVQAGPYGYIQMAHTGMQAMHGGMRPAAGDPQSMAMLAAAQQQMAAYQMAAAYGAAYGPGAMGPAGPGMPPSPTAATPHGPLSPTHSGSLGGRQGSLGGGRRSSARYGGGSGGNGSHRSSASQTPRSADGVQASPQQQAGTGSTGGTAALPPSEAAASSSAAVVAAASAAAAAAAVAAAAAARAEPVPSPAAAVPAVAPQQQPEQQQQQQ